MAAKGYASEKGLGTAEIEEDLDSRPVTDRQKLNLSLKSPLSLITALGVEFSGKYTDRE